jgi:alginate O-acetyltransferase complex protein AlgI
MIFIQPAFFAFFLVVGGVYWFLRSNSARKLWLLAASYFFYACWDWRFCGLLALTTAVDYVAARRMARAPTRPERRPWLYATLLVNLGILGFFKYFDFFVESGTGVLALFGLRYEPLRLDIVLPAGISFYTFQSLSHSIDAYRTGNSPRRSFSDYALFVAFFPNLVSGPILRSSQFLPQLEAKRRLADVRFRAALSLFLVGFVKKACVADRLAPVVAQIFQDPEAAGSAACWMGAALFMVQLYCDFSGYSDMAVGVAELLGYRLVENFRFPFVARSVGDFWSRWHISLTSWIRDYLYMWLDAVWLGLGGKRSSRWRIYFALFGVYLAVGVWHGASYNFVLFGLFAGLLVVLETAGRLAWITSRGWLALPYMALFWLVSGVLFRAGDLATVHAYLGNMFAFRGGTPPVSLAWTLVVPLFLAAHLALYKRIGADFLEGLSDWAYAALLGLTLALVLPWVSVGYQAFVYFQF